MLDLDDTTIPIEYRNKTKDRKVHVVVTSKNLSEDSDNDKYIAWKTLTSQTKVYFKYPKETQVCAYYEYDNEIIMCGPFGASEGSYWKICQEDRHEAPELVEGNAKLHLISYVPINHLWEVLCP